MALNVNDTLLKCPQKFCSFAIPLVKIAWKRQQKTVPLGSKNTIEVLEFLGNGS